MLIPSVAGAWFSLGFPWAMLVGAQLENGND